MTNTLKQLAAAGTSPWLDNIRRGWLVSGEFRRMVDEGVVGVTSNPTIFQKAIAGSSDYDSAVAALQAAAIARRRLLRARDRGRARGGRPDPARLRRDRPSRRVRLVRAAAGDGERHRGLDRGAPEFFGRIDRPNIFIKIPGTAEGVPGDRGVDRGRDQRQRHPALRARGLRGHPQGLHPRPRAARRGGPADRRRALGGELLRQPGRHRGRQRSCRRARRCAARRGREREARLPALPARSSPAIAGRHWPPRARTVQRPLWASTGTKNPAYSDVLYVDELIGPDCVNTMPEGTIAAFLDHGTVRAHG